MIAAHLLLLLPLLMPAARGQQAPIPGTVFVPAHSDTSSVESQSFATAFADGSALTGSLGSDVVALAGVSAPAEFGLGDASAAAGTWHQSGILGLGVQTGGAGVPPLLESLLPTADRKFVVALEAGGGTLWLGQDVAAMPALPALERTYSSVATQYNDFAVPVDSIRFGVDDLPLGAAGPVTAHVDTGASALILPAVAFARFEELVVRRPNPQTQPSPRA